jgi:two-component system aerobic respiration control sensor histidine kinase ArcB
MGIFKRKRNEIAALRAENIALKAMIALDHEREEEIFSLRNILSLMPCHLYWKNRQGENMGCNVTQAELLNLPNPEAIIGKTAKQLMAPELAEKIDAIDEAVMTSGIEKIAEENGFDLEGNPAVYFTRKVPLRNKAGKIVGLLGVSIDITERKKMEDELRIAKEKAETADKIKSEFIAVASHELRNPLVGITGIISFLIQGNLTTKETEQYYGMLNDCSIHMLSLVNDILDFSQLEAGKRKLVTTPVNLQELVKEVASMFTATTKEKGLEFIVDYSLNTPSSIVADSSALRQVLINLVRNSIKFTEHGYIKLNVTCSKQTSKAGHFTIAVEDTGKGIPADKKEIIFNRFTQLDDPYSRPNSRYGTGLGLSITKQLLNLMHAQIDVESELGKGSVFTISADFPLQNDVTKESPKPETITNDSLVKIKALMVEDDPVVSLVQKSFLTLAGCEVETAFSAKTALELLKKKQYQIIFTDIGLPDMNGFDFIKAIRQDDNITNGIPIIALTGHSSSEEIQACLDAGANAVLTKPTTEQKIKEIIASYQSSN